MACGSYIKLIIMVILCFSFLICMNSATPITRSANLVQKSQRVEAAKEIHMENVAESVKMDTIVRRMGIEVNDYPRSGANNRHTPRLHELERGCMDC